MTNSFVDTCILGERASTGLRSRSKSIIQSALPFPWLLLWPAITGRLGDPALQPPNQLLLFSCC